MLHLGRLLVSHTSITPKLERLAMDKHSSLIGTLTCYGKKFTILGASTIKPFTAVIYRFGKPFQPSLLFVGEARMLP